MNGRCSLAVLTAAMLAGQPPAAPTGASAPSTFHVSTRLIQVNVIVHDKKGEPITGLSKDQFTILDQGVSQKIVFFSEHSITAAAAQPSAPQAGGSANSFVFSNRPDEENAPAGSVTAVLFDSLNTKLLDAGFARARVAKFLHAIRPDDRIALYGLSTRLVVLHDFTDDADALVKALSKFNANDNSETAATKFSESNASDLFAGAINDTNQRMSDLYMGTRVENTAAAMETIARHLAGVPGRKNLVWVSGSFPVSIGYFQDKMTGTNPQQEAYGNVVQRAARALSEANVAIYPVDAKALTTLGDVYNAATAPNLGPNAVHTRIPKPPPVPMAEIETMETLARATGGKVFMNTNDIEGAVRTAIDDSRSTYVIGYYPDHNQWNGKFREIKIQVKHPGAEVRYRRGYSAFPDAPLDEKRPPLTAADATAGPLESTELGLSLQVEPVAGANGARQIRARLRFDTAGMGFDQQDGKWLDDLDVLWVQLDANGALVVSNGQTLTLKLSPETYQAAVGNGVRMTTTETIASPTAEIRFLARDRGTGAKGSVKIPVAKVFGK